jgi:hypothetical protein
MDSNMIKNIQQNMLQSDIKPLYSDEVLVAHTIKTGKDEKGKLTKEGHLFLIFVDATNQKPIAKIAVSPLTAKGMLKALSESVTKIDKELKSKSLPKRPREDPDYIR